MNNKHTRMLVEGGIVVALSKILSFIVLFKMPLGGSVTLCSRLPIIIYAIRWGLKSGIGAGVVYGLIDLMMGGYVIHPLQAILDYILSYGAMGLSGIRFGQKITLKSVIGAVIIAYFVSGLFNVLSGYVYFYDMTTALKAGFKNFLAYDFAYNYSFLTADMAILMIVLIAAFKRLKPLFENNR